jgi:hypothetical protein
MLARIFRPARTATQSGTAKTKQWVLDYAPAAPRKIEPLMGWTSSTDMLSQVRLTFPTKEEAVAYAERHGIPYRVEEPKPDPVRKGLSYSDNFRSTRIGQWTH